MQSGRIGGWFMFVVVCAMRVERRSGSKLGCHSSCLVRRGRSSSPLNCTFYDTTLTCEQRSETLLRASGGNASSLPSPPASFLASPVPPPPSSALQNPSPLNDGRRCPKSALSVVISAYTPNSVHAMFVRIRVTMTVDDPRARAVILRWSCVEGSPFDAFCQNLSRPDWPQFFWPCRMVEWRRPVQDDDCHDDQCDDHAGEGDGNGRCHRPPATASVFVELDCFTLPVMSTIQLTISLYPLQCDVRYLVKGPSGRRLTGAVLASDWIPFIVLDDNDGRGIAVNLSSPPERLNIDRMLVEVWNASTGVLEMSRTLQLPDTRFYVDGLREGGHFLDVHVLHGSCPQSRCLTQHLAFNFTGSPPTALTTADRRRTLLYFAALFFATGIILLLTFVVALIRRRLKPKALTAVTFTKRPKVFLIYSNDSGHHSEVVLQLANFLSTSANCDVMFDRWSTAEAGETFDPYAWIAHCLNCADFFLVVMSEGTKLFFQYPRRFRLVCVAPWPDTFEPSMALLLPRLLRFDDGDFRRGGPGGGAGGGGGGRLRTRAGDVTGADRFSDRVICVRFSYSADDCVLPFWRMLSCSRFELPAELPALVCHLHSWSVCQVDVSGIVTSGGAASALPAAVADCSQAIASGQQPPIDESRLQPISSSDAANADRSMVSIIQLLTNVSDQQSTSDAEELFNVYRRRRDAASAAAFVTSKPSESGERYRLLPPPAPQPQEAPSSLTGLVSCSGSGMTTSAGRYSLLPADGDC